jgi:NAD(P)-dependent dehydrogenase (short-subunit alcohol dehydrogenase family)
MGNRQRVVFISGGGSGIGLFLAKHFAAGGSGVAIFDLALSDAVRDDLGALANSAALSLHQVDVRDANTLEAAAGEAAAALGSPTLAINCAGVQGAAPFLELSTEQFSRVLDTNLLGSRNFAAAVLPHMGRGAKLALVASLAGLVPTYGYAAYNASKFGVVGLAGALRMDCLPMGIDVTVVCPPEVATPMVEEELKTIHPVTRELKQVAGSLDLESAGREILAGLESDDFFVIPGFRARMIARLGRWFPGILRRTSDRIILRMCGA